MHLRSIATLIIVSFIGSTQFAFANSNFGQLLANAADERTKHQVTYNGRYEPIGFPWGDVPDNIGVCSDVIIRAYRKLGIDLQHLVNHDMSINFHAYPSYRQWQLRQPDSNIDHRRVLNLQVFFARAGKSLPLSSNPRSYYPGDLVTWNIRPGLPHIGIVSDKLAGDGITPLIIHNISNGPEYSDILFKMAITGHFRYKPI